MELRHVLGSTYVAVAATALLPIYKLNDTDIVLLDTGYAKLARRGLPLTGERDRRTWQHRVRLYAQPGGVGTRSYPVRITHPEGAQTPQRI
mgnify:CR=1 FL=1